MANYLTVYVPGVYTMIGSHFLHFLKLYPWVNPYLCKTLTLQKGRGMS